VRILFAGSPEIALPSLRLVAARGELAGVLTGADVQKGRGMRPSAQPVAEEAEGLSPGVPILKLERLGADAREAVAALAPELLVSFAYSRIFGPKFLALFPRGGINVHPSLLPLYRGCAPIPAAILGMERETGVTVQALALEMDSGDILKQVRIPLTGRETTASLSGIVAEAGAGLLGSTLDAIARGELEPVPQDHAKATYCGALKKEDGRIDWTRGAREIDARVRAFDPWPLSFTSFGGTRLNVLAAEPLRDREAAGRAGPGEVVGVDKLRGILIQTGEGLLAVARLQFETKKALGFKDFLNGTRNFVGSTLGGDSP
jgi:methionyl-tRNA formyltransferase